MLGQFTWREYDDLRHDDLVKAFAVIYIIVIISKGRVKIAYGGINRGCYSAN